MTVREKVKEYPTKKGKRICLYVVFEKKVNGNITEKYCGLSKKNKSWIKAYTKEVEHLQTRFEYYLNALMCAKEKLESYQDSPEISTTMEAKNRQIIAPEIGEGSS